MPTPTPTVAKVTLTPNQIARGTSHTILIESTDCVKRTFEADDKVILKKDLDLLSKKGIEVTSAKKIDDCKFTAEITVTNSATFGPVAITANYLEGGAAGSQTLTFNVVKEEPLPPGPLVPGLEPQVDIMWSVVPQSVVKDNFGQRVGKLFYCIEVVIGNDSGYDLQIATVGFQLGPTGKHASVIAEAGQTSSEKIIAAQKEALTKGFQEKTADCDTKYKNRATFEDFKAYLTCIDDKMAEVIKGVSDTQGLTIAALQQQRDQLAAIPPNSPNSRIPSSSYRTTRGSLEHGQFWNLRDTSLRILKALGPLLTGFTPYFHVLTHQRNYAEAINVISNPLEKGVELVLPDETVQQLQRLDEQTLRDGTIIQNNRQIRTRTFIPKRILGLEKKYRDDPLVVMMSLGKLHIIGYQIDYKNRISITSAPSGEVKPPPTLNPSATETFLQDAEKTITLTGTNLDNASVSSDDPNGIEVTKVANTTSSVTVKVKVTEAASPGPHNLIVRTPSPPAFTFPINVERPAPKITPDTDKPDKTFTQSDGKDIKASLTEDLEYKVTVQGSYLQGAKLKALDNGGKQLEVAKQPDQSQTDGKSFTATIRVPKETPAGTYEFEVRNDRPANDNKPAKFKVEVKKQDAPTIDPGSQTLAKDSSDKNVVGNPGRSQDVTITVNGNNLNGAEVIVKEGGNAAGKLEPVKPEKVNTKAKQLTATIKVKPEAAPANGSVDYELQVKTPGAPPADFKLTVQPQKGPSITSPTDPLPGKPGQTISVVVVGANLEGAKIKPQTGLQVKSGPTPNGDGTQFTAEITIAADALAAGASEKIFTVEVTNSNTTAPSATFKIKVTP